MESLLKNLKEHVTCSICLDTFTEPKTISCLHTFCCECLKKHALTTQRDGQFRCPECQAQVGVPDHFDKLPTGFLQNSLLGLLAVQQSGDGSEISCGNCRKKSAETSFCFECGRFMCPDCVNAHELLRNVAFQGHKVRPTKQFQAEDYEALLRRQSFCSQQYHEREVTRFFCIDCQSCVCQICVVTDHKNHTLDPLDKAADGEKTKLVAGAELMKRKRNVCSEVLREFEQTDVNLETNITAAKHKVAQVAERMVAKIREREREAITALENTRVSTKEKLNSAKTQVQSLAKQINQAVKFANYLVQRSSSSDIMESRKSLEQRFEDLDKTPLPALPVSSFVKFVSSSEPENLTLGFIATTELDLPLSVIEGLTQDFQAGVEAELVIFPNLTDEAQGKIRLEVLVEPAEEVGSLMTCEKDGNFLVKFTPKVPGTYTIEVSINGSNLHKSPFTVRVKERRLEVVRELDLKTLRKPSGIAVNSKGLIAVADYSGHHILILSKEGKYIQKLGCKGENAGQLNCPSDVAYINDDEILVVDELNHRIQQFNIHTGNVVKAFGRKGTGEGEFQGPVRGCMDGEGRVVVADFGNNRMQVFKDGKPVFQFGDSGSQKLKRPTGCIFHLNTFIVSDAGNNCLKIFDHSGKFLRTIGELGKGDGQLNFPRGLCVEQCGNHHNILVCDSNGTYGRIVQFSVDGSFTGKTITKLQQPVGIATMPDGRILVSDCSARTIYILK